MKRYLAFRGEDYYALGGWHDFIGDYEDLEQAKIAICNISDWGHIVDSTTMKIVWEFPINDQ